MVDISYGLDLHPIEKPMEKEITLNNFLQHAGVVIVYVWAEWCLPCRDCAPEFERLKTEYDTVEFMKDNIDDECSFHKDYVNVVPSFFIYKDGEQKATIQGGEFDTIRFELDFLLQ
jgi:thioredoxin 1